ncbi:MAG: hypothetical protein U1E05_21870 [Patescibacteria group bacterium]|nr:hypothetical protein [Patescibacteria group bacterium]
MSRSIGPWIRGRFACFLGVAAVAWLAAGCDAQQRLPVYGEVRFAGHPIEVGQITFYPSTRAAAVPVVSDIQKGAFVLPAADGLRPGVYRVYITAVQERKANESTFAGMGLRLPEQFIPSKYNDATVLEVEVQPHGDNYFEFDLE